MNTAILRNHQSTRTQTPPARSPLPSPRVLVPGGSHLRLDAPPPIICVNLRNLRTPPPISSAWSARFNSPAWMPSLSASSEPFRGYQTRPRPARHGQRSPVSPQWSARTAHAGFHLVDLRELRALPSASFFAYFRVFGVFRGSALSRFCLPRSAAAQRRRCVFYSRRVWLKAKS